MKTFNDSIRSIKIKMGQAGDDWAFVIHMYVWLKTDKMLHVRRISHKTGLEQSFATEVSLMFEEIRRKYYKVKKKG